MRHEAQQARAVCPVPVGREEGRERDPFKCSEEPGARRSHLRRRRSSEYHKNQQRQQNLAHTVKVFSLSYFFFRNSG